MILSLHPLYMSLIVSNQTLRPWKYWILDKRIMRRTRYVTPFFVSPIPVIRYSVYWIVYRKVGESLSLDLGQVKPIFIGISLGSNPPPHGQTTDFYKMMEWSSKIQILCNIYKYLKLEITPPPSPFQSRKYLQSESWDRRWNYYQ